MSESQSHGGRPKSWLGVGVVFLGFLLGGIGLVAGPAWILFWVGVAIAVVGGVFMLATGIFEDVVLAEPVQQASGEDDPDAPKLLEEASGRPTRRDAGELPHG
ncbi:HGxxPAAW family protein [Actinocorallia longicatena]|uniref:HGxxPAAW family protein n=1 Tax=Actinocorallia longicatena TaxID=111803 RepID=UPI0031CF322F